MTNVHLIMADLVMILGLVLCWIVLFALFTSKSRITIALAVTLLIILAAPFITKSSYSFYAEISRWLFARNASGVIQLIASPMKIPDRYINKPTEYCNRFQDQNARTINLVSYRDDGAYCGYYWEFYEKKTIFIPYQMSNGKVKYWATPDSLIIDSYPDANTI